MNRIHTGSPALPPGQHAYAPFIDGLRAIAVLAVIAYHLDASWLPGGLAGVDIFFVISGFVVSASVSGFRPQRLWQFAFQFYARRVRRIAPALIVCLLVTALLSALFIPQAWLSDTNARTGLFAFFGLSNLILVATHDGYFTPRVEFNPYMHTWSLGVEEQFYLIFPALFFLWVRAAGQRRKPVMLLFAGGGAASLVCAGWLSVLNPTFAFYLLPARFWELAAGVLLFQSLTLAKREPQEPASGAGPVRAPAAMPPFVSLLALAALAVLVFALAWPRTHALPFPGALLPVASTLGILALLYRTDADCAARRLLSSRAFVFVGRISYSLYLWHWPVLVLARWTTGIDTGPERVAVLVITFAAAVASFYFVENPVRRAPMLTRLPGGAVVAAGIGVIVMGSALSFGISQAQPKLSLSVVSHRFDDWSPYVATQVRYGDCREQWTSRKLDGGPVWIYSRTGCSASRQYAGTLYVIGDSHAMALSRMLREFALDTGVDVFAYNNGGCPFIGLLPRESADERNCRSYDDDAFAEILANAEPGDVVFMPSLRLARFSDEYARFDDGAARAQMFGPDALKARRASEQQAIPMLRRLAAKGVKIVLEAPEPVFKIPPFRCSDWFNRDNPICSAGEKISRIDIEVFRTPVLDSYARIESAVSAVSVWDPLPVLCPGAVCSAHAGDTPLFFDGDHLSGYANRLLLPSFAQFVGRLMNGAPDTRAHTAAFSPQADGQATGPQQTRFTVIVKKDY